MVHTTVVLCQENNCFLSRLCHTAKDIEIDIVKDNRRQFVFFLFDCPKLECFGPLSFGLLSATNFMLTHHNSTHRHSDNRYVPLIVTSSDKNLTRKKLSKTQLLNCYKKTVTSSDKNLTMSEDELLSNPVVGSSANKHFGVFRRDVANERRFFSPPDNPFLPLKFLI